MSHLTWLQALLPARNRLRLAERAKHLPEALRVVIESTPGPCSLILTELWLPDNWNGILLGYGNGGPAGKFLPGCQSYVREGYAVVQTDMGTSRLVSGEMKTGNPDVWKDYGWRATHVMTVLAKLLLRGYYGKSARYAYFIGSSAGGLQAFSEAQRFPEDYDGILAGVPSNNTLNLIVYLLWLHIHLRDDAGDPILPQTHVQQITACAVAFFQSRGDGEPGDDFITFPYRDKNTTADFMAFLAQQMPELTPAQREALRKAYEGPVNPRTGQQIFSGMPFGSEIHCRYLTESSPDGAFSHPWIKLFFGADFRERSFDFGEDYEKMAAAVGRDFSANYPELHRFRERGGKLMVFSGCADPSGPCGEAIKYFSQVCSRMGGVEPVLAFYRLFLLPGKAHGDNGIGTNVTWGDTDRSSMLAALRKWREEGKAPEYLVAAHIRQTGTGEAVKFIRKILPYGNDRQEGNTYPKSCDDALLADSCRDWQWG